MLSEPVLSGCRPPARPGVVAGRPCVRPPTHYHLPIPGGWFMSCSVDQCLKAAGLCPLSGWPGPACSREGSGQCDLATLKSSSRLTVSSPAPTQHPSCLTCLTTARFLLPHPVLSLPPPPARPAQFMDGRYWIYSPRHRRLRAVTLSSSGTVSDHSRPPGSPAPIPLLRTAGSLTAWPSHFL